jgi:two-component system response regulator AtoC
VAATNRNLEKMIAEGTFREDLFYRLNVMPIFLPPLRDRRDDIPALVQHFIKKFAKAHSSIINGISKDAIESLKSYRWPGNIRELENAIERSFIVENSNQIQVESLPDALRQVETLAGHLATTPSSHVPLDFEMFKEQAEKDFIISALKANKGRINQTVALANIPKNTLLRKIKKYGIVVEEYKD